MSRLQTANELGVPESWLRALEEKGLVPPFSEADRDAYAVRVRLIRAGRERGLTLREVREVIAPRVVPGEEGGAMAGGTSPIGKFVMLEDSVVRLAEREGLEVERARLVFAERDPAGAAVALSAAVEGGRTDTARAWALAAHRGLPVQAAVRLRAEELVVKRRAAAAKAGRPFALSWAAAMEIVLGEERGLYEQLQAERRATRRQLRDEARAQEERNWRRVSIWRGGERVEDPRERLVLLGLLRAGHGAASLGLALAGPNLAPIGVGEIVWDGLGAALQGIGIAVKEGTP